MTTHDERHAAHTGNAHGTPAHGAHAHSHQHAHDHDHADIDWSAMAPLLERQAETQSSLYADAAAWLGTLVPVSGVRRVLDVGSGPGVITGLLAEAFPAAETVAVDGSPELLAIARSRAEARGLGSRVSTLHAELPAQFDALGEADVIWASESLHHIGDQRAALASFAGLLRPGGLLVLVEGGLPARRLPWNIGFGRPGLEARLDAAYADRFGAMRASLPDSKEEVDDWRGLLAGAGLVPSGTRSFLSDIPAPVPPVVREQIVAQFERSRSGLGEHLAADDRDTLDRLLDPSDPDSLHHRPDVFQLVAKTVHTARKG
ncbi:class I SAM-dependent methyltransferase [Streptomyces sp. NPDC048629]|uniref:class I SAM-dependent methyltransferase n=1 Tax=Streptomyces sp. NPDC048629 TaxID=3154824 RepID=UPI003448E75F